MENGYALDILDLKKSFRKINALNGINVKITRGSIIGLLGQNGAGKSTLIRLLSGIMRPSSGTAKIYGFDLLEETDEIKQITGLLPEEYALYEKLTVYEYLQFIASLYDLEDEKFEFNLDKIAKQLELLSLKDRLIESLSKGQKQKVALSASLIHEPSVLFLDEPLANLDVKAQRTVRSIIRDYKSKERVIIIASHLLNNIKAICDEVIIIDEGQILFSGTLDEFQGTFESLEEAYLEMVIGGE